MVVGICIALKNAALGAPHFGAKALVLRDAIQAGDDDGDGSLSLREWRKQVAANPKFARAAFAQQADLDGDGLMDAESWGAQLGYERSDNSGVERVWKYSIKGEKWEDGRDKDEGGSGKLSGVYDKILVEMAEIKKKESGKGTFVPLADVISTSKSSPGPRAAAFYSLGANEGLYWSGGVNSDGVMNEKIYSLALASETPTTSTPADSDITAFATELNKYIGFA